MDIDTIKVFASTYVMEQENIPIKSKCEMVEFIKESDGDDILHLIFNGSPPDHQLDGAEKFVLRSQAEYHIAPIVQAFIAEAFLLTEDDLINFRIGSGGELKATGKKILKTGQTVATDLYRRAAKYKGPVKGIGWAAIVAAGSAAAYQVYKKYMSKAARNCKGKSGMDKRNCMVAFQKKGLQAKANTLQTLKSHCSKSKSPGKCNQKYDSKIKKIRYKIATLHSKY